MNHRGSKQQSARRGGTKSLAITSDKWWTVAGSREKGVLDLLSQINNSRWCLCHNPGPGACSCLTPHPVAGPPTTTPPPPARLPCNCPRGLPGGVEDSQTTVLCSEDTGLPGDGSRLWSRLRIALARGRCLPESATPCWEPINKQQGGWLFEYITPLNPSDASVPTLFFCLTSTQKNSVFSENPGHYFSLFWQRNSQTLPWKWFILYEVTSSPLRVWISYRTTQLLLWDLLTTSSPRSYTMKVILKHTGMFCVKFRVVFV